MTGFELAKAREKAENDAGFEINCIGSPEGSDDGYYDRYTCTCGWVGPWHFGGNQTADARADYVTHIRKNGAEINYPEPPREICVIPRYICN